MSGESAGRQVDILFPGGGACGALVRGLDWSTTPLGPVEAWAQSLRTTVSIVLGATTPAMVFWGPRRVQVYNDGYRPILGNVKHPAAQGQAAYDTWPEIYDVIGPQMDTVFAGGAVNVRDGQLMLERNGFLEECFFDWSYSAIRDERGDIIGIYNTCAETTSRVLSDRRLALVRELSLHTSVNTRVADVIRTACTLLGDAPADIPFALVYALDDDTATRLCCAGLDDASAAAPCRIRRGDANSWNVFDVDRRVVDDVGQRFGDVIGKAWPEPVTKAMIIPLPGAAGDHVLVVGMSPRLVDDAAYRDFLQLLGRQLAASLAVTHALEQEQRRTAELAALDRDKTHFFSTISHEFRTPLTLLLAPIEDALAEDGLDRVTRERLELVHRNARRLQKLVNTLLEVARLDAGRATASFAATDVGTLTGDLASGFRSAIERAGLRLDVDIGAGPIEGFVDRDLWEKVVLNLLSNALKFTFNGGIRIEARADGDAIRVVVEDSGVGIPADELPRLFQRFHRVAGTRSRTGEGSGIGLSLVHDVVTLHGGRIDVDSEIGRGTRFTITVPRGHAHLDPAAIATTTPPSTTNLDAFVTEALGWVGKTPTAHGAGATKATKNDAGARILVVDDNADMRSFIARLLAERWDVEVAADGVEALTAIRAHRPDLVVSDVMMPNLDGFGLLAAVRAEDALAHLPIVLVSARAGEDARIEAIAAGADDYIVKPFVARELIARIAARLDVARLRTAIAVEQRFLQDLFANAPASITVLCGPDHVVEMTNLPAVAMLGDRQLIGRPVREALPELAGQGWFASLDEVYASGETRTHHAAHVVVGHPIAHERYIDVVQQPRRNAEGVVDGIVTFGFDVTERVRAARQLEHESRSKDEFLAMLGHELRNPLAPVLSAVELARAAGGDVVARHLDVIERQTLNLTRIVDDLLDVSRITRGLIMLRRETVDLSVVARAAVDVVTELVERKGHTVTVTVPSTPMEVDGDAVRLEQVLVNLLTNAAKYTDDGGHIAVVIEQQTRGSRDFVVVAVTDDGIGIDVATLPHVFDLFQQAQRTLDRALGGLGIGLTVVKRLVELHGGTITAASAGPGKGATFSFMLPLTTVPSATLPAPKPAATAATPDVFSILVVDDNVDAADALADLLSMWGHDIAVAYDGAAALAHVEAAVPDIVFLDIGMPDIDGFEVGRRLRAMPTTSALWLVALTGYGQPGDRQRSAEAGFDEHLVKPMTPSALQALLQRRRRH